MLETDWECSQRKPGTCASWLQLELLYYSRDAELYTTLHTVLVKM